MMPNPSKTRRVRGVSPELQQAAWTLRAGMTPAEQILWNALRGKQLHGLRFQTQHPVGQFVLDFYSPACKLAIELDGAVHDSQQEQDRARTEFLQAYGYHILRFHNKEIMQNLPDVLRQISELAQSLIGQEAPPPPSLGEPERKGFPNPTPPNLGAGGLS